VVPPQYCICLAEILKEDLKWCSFVRNIALLQYSVQLLVGFLGKTAFVWATVLLAAFSPFMAFQTVVWVVLTLLCEGIRKFTLGVFARRPRTAKPLKIGMKGCGEFNVYQVVSLCTYLLLLAMILFQFIVSVVLISDKSLLQTSPTKDISDVNLHRFLLTYFSVYVVQGGLHILFIEVGGWFLVYWFPIRFLRAFYYLYLNALDPADGGKEGWVFILTERPFDDVASLERQTDNLSLLWLGFGKVSETDTSKMTPSSICQKLSDVDLDTTQPGYSKKWSFLGSYKNPRGEDYNVKLD
jgi:hypothetical protein